MLEFVPQQHWHMMIKCEGINSMIESVYYPHWPDGRGLIFEKILGKFVSFS